MRDVTSHRVNALNAHLRIQATEEAGPSGSPVAYVVSTAGKTLTTLQFQRGGSKEQGVNGLTNEALLAVLIDRIGSISDTHAGNDTDEVLRLLESAELWMQKRSIERRAREF